LDNFLSSKISSHTKSALSQQRSKLKHEVFEDINTLQLEHFYDNSPDVKKWKGYRLIAIDGSTLQLPRSEELIRDFGIFETRTENNRKVLLARISQAYDVLNDLSIHANIQHYQTSELALADSHLPFLQKTDLLLMDRGYAAFWFMAKLCSSGQKFVIRLKENRWNIAKELLLSDKTEKLVKIKPSNEAIKRCKEKGIPADNLNLRIIRVKLRDGEDYVVITNLLNTAQHTAQELSDLYRLRWPVEESYKLLKVRAELENLSGKSTLAVKQDFYRIICRSNLSQIVSILLTTNQIKHINTTRNAIYKIHKTQSYRKTRELIKMVYQDHIRKWINKVLQIAFQLFQQAEIVRPDRSHPVNLRYGARPANFMAYKP
jgi:hypothetical protein